MSRYLPSDPHEIRDEEIDTSEVPELNEAFFVNAILTLPGANLIDTVRTARKDSNMKYHELYTPNVTPQTEQADPRQTQNNAGGFSFSVTPEQRLLRFLILGSDLGTYYVTPRELTKDNAKCVLACLDNDPEGTVRTIAGVSLSGRAPKNDPAIFALALAAGHPLAKSSALAAIPAVCRTGTHLFQFVQTVKSLGLGWGRSMARGVARWYTEKRDHEALIYQVTKYRQRGGMSHKDVLRLCHAKSDKYDGVFRWIVAGSEGAGSRVLKNRKYEPSHIPEQLLAFDELQKTDNVQRAVALIQEWQFTHEMIPTPLLKEKKVWEALLTNIPYMALIRNLGRLGSLDMLVSMSDTAKRVQNLLLNEEALRRSKIHPLALLQALKVYGAGRGDKGSLTWTPVAGVKDALEDAFYAAFGNVKPTGKSTLLALDVSASMTWNPIGGTSITPREASAVLAMVTARVEEDYEFVGFSHELVKIPITKKNSLQEVISTIEKIPMGATNCALPILLAEEKGWQVDMFHVYTDSETYAGLIHPHEALRRYRQKSGIPAKLAVVGMTSTGFTIADPSDAGMLDVVGFDTATPQLLSDFALTSA